MAAYLEKIEDAENYKVLPYRGDDVILPKMTYRDYKRIPDDIRCELINGVIYMMASPDDMHQWILLELGTQLKIQLKGKKCTPYVEFDVRLFYTPDESDATTVRPDIIVVCDETKVFGKKNCEGPPDFVIEIASDSSQKRDFEYKKLEYEKAGVKEYWIVCKGTLHRFLLSNSVYKESVFLLKESPRIEVSFLEGCSLDFQPIIDRFISAFFQS